jgi:hypothetical protein
MARRALSSNIGREMTKLLTALLVLAMAVHLIKPLNLPGLRRRSDFWRIALFAFAIWTIALLINEVL